MANQRYPREGLRVSTAELAKSAALTTAADQDVKRRATNGSGSSIADGNLVYIASYNTTNLEGSIANAQATSGGQFAEWVVDNGAAIANGAQGFLSKVRLLTAVDTSGGTVGDPIYLSDGSAGGWTRTKPTLTDKVQVVGRLITISASVGRVLIDLSQGIQQIVHNHANNAEGGSLTTPTMTDIIANSITGGDASLGVTGIAGVSAGAGGAVPAAGGAGAAGTGGGTGGAGGAISATGGAGGTETTGTAGAGGASSLIAGIGGATSEAAGTGGAGGAVAITAGTGGADSEGGSGTGGVGGDVTLTAGGGGAGNTDGAPGNIKSASPFLFPDPQVIAMGDATVTLTRVPGTPTGTLMTSNILRVDAESSATENLLLPPEADCNGMLVWIINTGGESVIVQNDASGTIDTVATTEFGIFFCDGTAWTGMNQA